MDVWVGTSGYSYDDWDGPFYPAGTRPAQRLRHYARFFPVVELNFTFYRPPTPAMLLRLADGAPSGLRYVVKLPRTLSHEESPRDLAGFHASVHELSRRGQLLGVLCQLPQTNHYTRRRLEWLEELARPLGPYRMAVEFRHRSWARPDLPAWLAERGIDLVAVDAPAIDALYPSGLTQSTDRVYVRFHSRNAANWYLSDKERYDYDYDDRALLDWVNDLRAASARTREALLLFNNCHRSQAVDNARRVLELLRGLPEMNVLPPPEADGPVQRSLFEK